MQCCCPQFRLTTVSRRTFPVAASLLWNSLPSDFQSFPSLPVFRQRLKTFLFRQSFPNIVLWLYCNKYWPISRSLFSATYAGAWTRKVFGSRWVKWRLSRKDVIITKDLAKMDPAGHRQNQELDVHCSISLFFVLVFCMSCVWFVRCPCSRSDIMPP